MKYIITFFLLLIFTISCKENEKQDASQHQKSKNNEKDSVMIQPVDLNNTVFMMHYQVNSLVDSIFLAPPNKMEDIYKDLLFELDIIISDIQNMDFQFEGSDKLIQSIEILMIKYKDLMKNKFPPIMKILLSDEIPEEEKNKIQEFDDEFNEIIIPLTKDFFKAQEEFALQHKIELVDY